MRGFESPSSLAVDPRRSRAVHWLAGVMSEGQSGWRFTALMVQRFETLQSFKRLSLTWKCREIVYLTCWSSLLQTIFFWLPVSCWQSSSYIEHIYRDRGRERYWLSVSMSSGSIAASELEADEKLTVHWIISNPLALLGHRGIFFFLLLRFLFPGVWCSNYYYMRLCQTNQYYITIQDTHPKAIWYLRRVEYNNDDFYKYKWLFFFCLFCFFKKATLKDSMQLEDLKMAYNKFKGTLHCCFVYHKVITGDN